MNNIVDGIEEERQRNQGRIAYLEATVSYSPVSTSIILLQIDG